MFFWISDCSFSFWLAGYAIGGLSGGENKDLFWRTVHQCTEALPDSKPRYCMGVGYPLDLVVCSALGADMFDCVYPSRTARFGTALVHSGLLKIRNQSYVDDDRPLDESCSCMVCQRYSRAYLNMTFGEPACASLLSFHNFFYMKHLMLDLRTSIVENRLPSFIPQFLDAQFPDHNYPKWTLDALHAVEIDVR